jgi:hypothetical protein
MAKHSLRQPGASFIETPIGIFTPAGNWFHTSSEAIERFVPGLLQKNPLSELIRDAEVWIRSADNISILLLLSLLLTTNVLTTIVVLVIFLPLWHIGKSAAFSRLVTVFLRFIDIEIVLLLIAVAPLSWLGMTERYTELVTGLAGFIILKFGIYRKLVDFLYTRLRHSESPLNDRLFRMILIKHAMSYGIQSREVVEMDKTMRDFISKRKIM